MRFVAAVVLFAAAPFVWSRSTAAQRWAYEASLKINVTPNEAEVYVDGYYAGRVDDFDGPFQRLHATPGEHEIVIYLRGHRSIRERLYLNRGSTRKVSGRLERLAPGDPDPGPPAPAPVSPTTTGHPGAPYPTSSNQTTRAGILAIRVQPGDAELLIDGERWQTRLSDERLLIELTEGPHVVELIKTGYRRFSTEVRIRPRQTTPLNVSLTKE